MKKGVLFLLGIGCLTGCGYRAQVEADQPFKDSIAQADGNKVLGNIRFGISQEEFERQKKLFSEMQRDTIYGICLQDIKGEFTPQNQLYTVDFISVFRPQELGRNPFLEFGRIKFGTPTLRDSIWIVGDRRITIAIKKQRGNAFGLLAKLRANPSYKLGEEAWKLGYYYTMTISSDSLLKVSKEQEKIERLQNEERRQQQERLKRERQEQKNQKDVHSL